MSRFQPFKALRYRDQARPRVNLDLLACPPYDVINTAQRQALADASRHNAVHLELPERDTERGLDEYQSAAQLLESWRAEGVLGVDSEPAFYVYRMSFTDQAGCRRTTTGVIGALQVGDSQWVLPHEQTLPKARTDRRDLLLATKVNLSPIFGLSLTEGLSELLATDDEPESEATDADGTVHALWAVRDPESVSAIAEAVGRNPVVIADGHHRYEVARQFHEDYPELPGSGAVMCLVVELSPDEIEVEAIHRLVALTTPAADDKLFERLDGHFDMVSVPATTGDWSAAETVAHEIRQAMERHGGIGLMGPRGRFVLIPKVASTGDQFLDIDSARLDAALAGAVANGDIEVRYQHDFVETIESLRADQSDYALLLRPVPVSTIAAAGRSGWRFPPKSTYFFPKVRAGMVFRSLLES